MAKVQFEPTIRGKGYSNLDFGAISLSRLEAKLKDDDDKRQRALQDRKNQDAQAAANIQTTNEKEEANLKQISKIDGLARDTRQSALEINRAQAVENNKAEIRKITSKGKEIQELIGYSKTLFEAYQTSEKKDWDASYKDALNYYVTNGQSNQTKLRMELLDDAAYDKSQGFHTVADEMAADGYTIPEVEWVRGRAKFDDYARLKADAIIAGDRWQPWLEKQLADRGISKTEDIQAFIQAATPEYLRANNLIIKDENGNDQYLSTDFLSPMIERMNKARNTIVSRAETRDAINQAEVRVNGYKTVLQAALSPTKQFNEKKAGEAINNLFDNLGRVPKADGSGWKTNAEIKAEMKTILEDINLFPDDAKLIEAIGAAQGKQNWYSDILPGILTTRAQNRATKEKNQAEAIKRVQETQMKTFDTYLKNRGKQGGWNGSRQIVKDGIEKMAKSKLNPNGIDRAILQDRYGKYLETSVEGKLDGDWYTSHYTKLFHEDYNLTSEELDDPTIPDGFVTDEIRQEVARRDAILDKADYKNLHKDRIEGALKNALVDQDLKKGGSIDPSYFTKLEQAKAQWRKCTVTSEDSEACTISLTKQIEEEGKGTTGKYGVTRYSDDGNERQANYFTQAQPAALQIAKKSKNDYTPLNSAEKAEIAGSLAKDPTLINKRLFLSVDQIKTASARIKAGQPFRYPQLLLDLEKILPGTAMELFRAQVKVAESDGLLDKHDLDVEDFRRVWHTQTGDPQGKHIIKTLDTLVDVQKTLQWTMNPASTRDPRFMSPVVNKTLQENANAAQGIVVPQTVEELKADPRKDYNLILKQWVPFNG